jgi:hypothetical protein
VLAVFDLSIVRVIEMSPICLACSVCCILHCSRQAGHRFGEHIERVMPLIVQYSREEDDELREHCLQAFEAFVHRCPKEITPHIHTVSLITQSVLGSISLNLLSFIVGILVCYVC